LFEDIEPLLEQKSILVRKKIATPRIEIEGEARRIPAGRYLMGLGAAIWKE
jgi:hypothetical protein